MSKTLLLADDSVTIQKVVGISFANEDVRIVTVDNGDDAVVRAREIKPDIVLADVVMPGKSGYDVCAAIKSDSTLRGIPVLLLTGTFETFDEDRAARVGADGHITKPFEAQALVELVNARLAGAAPAARGTKPPVAAKPAPVPVAKPSAPTAPPKRAPVEVEAEPFDFLEPEDTTISRPRAGTGQPIASSRASDRDAFAFDAEPIDAPELDADPLGLPDPVNQARTTLLLEEDGLGDAETAPPAGFSARDLEGDELTRAFVTETRQAQEPRPDEATSPPRAVRGDVLDPLDGVFDPVLDDESATRASREFDVSSPELEDPYRTRVLDDEPPASDAPTAGGFSDPLFEDEAADEFSLPAPAPRGAEPAQAAPPAAARATAPLSGMGVSELPPQLRGQVHETLEKVAWEALGDLSERIVREAVERIERVAWDVIPRLAETLIREEIRKLKGEE